MTTPDHTLPETSVTARRRPYWAVKAEALTLPGNPCLKVVYPSPLPGVIIFVHGVNSSGEWFDAAEEGLCKGLNARLQRNDDQVAHPRESGKLRPMRYTAELTEDGYIQDDLKPNTFVEPGSGRSPVIRFRWGYKASSEEVVQKDGTTRSELANVGGNILLDENNAWGGGPFVNGASALPDLFGKGSDTEVFGSLLELQHLQTSDRQIYSAPPRHYQAFAAWRLAKLVARVRELHRDIHERDCPITIVCHSQGNMVGLASAYFGSNHTEFGANKDTGAKGLGVADTYVLANPPYSLRGSRLDNFSQFDGAGRVTYDARVAGLRGFFGIVRHFQGHRAQHYSNHAVDQFAFNGCPQNGDTPRSAAADSADHKARGHVFLYCCPHDRVISVAPVQGMGWLGMNDKDVDATEAHDILFQRVWAQTKPGTPYKVGAEPGYLYRYWKDTIGATPADAGSGWDATTSTFKPQNTKPTFWSPSPDTASVSFSRIWGDSRKSIWGKLFASAAGVPIQALMWGGQAVKGATNVNADPAQDWAVRVNAPKVPSGGIVPQAVYLPHGSPKPGETAQADGVHTIGPFNQHKESASDALNRQRSIPEGQFDSYAEQRKTGHGNAASEAAMRYDQNAGVRQRARRELYNDDGTLRKGAPLAEDDVKKMNAGQHHTLRGTEFGAFEQKERTALMKDGEDAQTTNHSTILTNAMHAEHVLAYDVDVGMCHFDETLMNQFRRMADWRWCKPQTDKDEYPPGRDPENDSEYTYYNTKGATYKKGALAQHKDFDAARGAIKAIGIPDARNPGRFDAHHMPPEGGTRHA